MREYILFRFINKIELILFIIHMRPAFFPNYPTKTTGKASRD